MVGVHPFGGFNMSGTDSKAGGHDYLLLFMQAKSIATKIGATKSARAEEVHGVKTGQAHLPDCNFLGRHSLPIDCAHRLHGNARGRRAEFAVRG